MKGAVRHRVRLTKRRQEGRTAVVTTLGISQMTHVRGREAKAMLRNIKASVNRCRQRHLWLLLTVWATVSSSCRS